MVVSLACCQVGGFEAWHDEGLVCLSYEPLVAFIPSWGHSQPSSPGRMWASQGSRVRFGGDSYDVLFEAYAPAQIAKRMHTVAYHLGGARHGRGLRGGHL